MKISFYTAAVGAKSGEAKLGVIANNMANLNTDGYKSKNASFADLIYTDMEEGGSGRGRLGHSSKLDRTESTFRKPGALSTTGRDYDFAIEGDGFFALYNPDTEQVAYTRNGRFDMTNQDGTFYLTDVLGRQVLDKDGSPIELFQAEDGERPEEEEALRDRVGIYKIPVVDGMENQGMSAYVATEKNGEIYAQDELEAEAGVSVIHEGMLESSNVELPDEMSKLIETQRAFQMALKMIETTDELEQTENELRR